MTHFYVRACSEGHYEVDFRPVRPGQTCRKCGRQLIDSCPVCGEPVKKWNYYGASMMPPATDGYELPQQCPKCGAEFPWHGKKSVRVPNRQGR